jgi:hypothetical protein
MNLLPEYSHDSIPSETNNSVDLPRGESSHIGTKIWSYKKAMCNTTATRACQLLVYHPHIDYRFHSLLTAAQPQAAVDSEEEEEGDIVIR